MHLVPFASSMRTTAGDRRWKGDAPAVVHLFASDRIFDSKDALDVKKNGTKE